MNDLSKFEASFYDLHCGVVGVHERPHKPVLLLAVIDLVEQGTITENLIPFSKGLRERFSRYFEIVRSHDDRDTPCNPYFYLRREPFWLHVATEGNESVMGALNKPPPIKRIPELIAGAELDDTLWNLLQRGENRVALRDTLITRYFPNHASEIWRTAGVAPQAVSEEKGPYELSGRSAGFRRIVLQVYEHQCAACGLRIRLPEGATVAEAAHLIPYSETRNDHPCNGIALCRNHHWAMDQYLITPGLDLLWHASRSLDDRQEGERELIGLEDRPLILPKEKAYYPHTEGIEWRYRKLR